MTVYAAISTRTRECYVGSTTRGCGVRQAEHRRDAQRWQSRAPDNRGERSKACSLPFHRKVWRHRGGMHGFAFVPVLRICSTRTRGSDARGVVSPGLVRDLRLFESCWQRRFEPGLCAPWCFSISRSECVKREAPCLVQGGGAVDTRGILMDTWTGQRWQQSRDWSAQFHPGRIRPLQSLSESQKTALVLKLSGHGKQAKAQ